MAEAYRSSGEYRPAHASALAIYCSDGRFVEAVDEFLSQKGFCNADRLTMPGGPALFGHPLASYSERDAVTRAASFLIKSHSIRHVILVAHETCGYYRQHHASESEESIKRRQVDDIKRARDSLKREHGDVSIALYYARVLDGQVAFDKVEE